MADDLDPEQLDAVNHAAGSLLLSAGAGSGKTRVLVQRYLKLLRDGAAVADLGAITFTEKAARELRDRIRTALREEQTKEEPGSVAWQRWKTPGEHLETAAIGTIHSLCTGLLRQHATVAGLKPDFGVLTESVGTAVREEAVLAALQGLLLESSSTSRDLGELVVLHGWTRTIDAVQEFIRKPDVPAWRAFATKPADAIAAEWTTIARTFLPARLAAAIDAVPLIAELEKVHPAIAEGKAKLRDVLESLKRFRDDPCGTDAAALRESAQVGNASAGKKFYGADCYDVVRDGYKAIRDLIDKSGLGELALPENLTAAAAVAQRMARVALHIEAAYSRRKRRDNVVDFDDQLILARNLLRDHPAVLASVRQEMKAILLDELQDTDPVQMEVVELILGDRLATGGLFAVGDAKQSIYRFRGADVTLFEQLREKLPKQSLTRNYRSRPGIIRFVNALCREWFPHEEPLLAQREPETTAGVEFLWTAVPGEKPAANTLRQAEAQALAGRIRGLIDQMRCQPGDIVLLFRKLSAVSIYEEALRQAGIEYYLVGGRAFFAQQEVNDLLNALRAIDNPADGVSVVGVLRSPICGLSDDAVMALTKHEEGIWEGLLAEMDGPPDEAETVRRTRRMLTQWRAVKDSLPLARLLQRILADSGYDAALLFEPLGERKLANLWKLQEMAREFDAAGYGLAKFIGYLGGQVRREPREEQAATVPEEAAHIVRIMSVHQAKGLEFPVVIVPDLGGKARESHGLAASWHRRLGAVVTVPGDSEEAEVGYPAWPCKLERLLEKNANEEESLRLLYVACTRARELLILSSGYGGEEIKANGEWLAALARAFDLATGKCRDEPGHSVLVKCGGRGGESTQKL